MKTKILLTAFFLFSSLSNWAQLPSYLPANGLVAWYPFNGNANDESGNGNNGTNNGASLTEDRFGNTNSAYYFSSAGCGTRIDANVNTSSIQTGLTISVWLKRVGNGCISPRILEFWPGDNGPGMAQWGWAFGYPAASNGIGLGSLTSNGFSCAGLIPNPSLTDWIQIAYTNDGTNGRIYYNGSLVSTIPSTGNPILASNLAIGRMNHPAYDAFNGNMDDLAVWNRALSDSEITNLFNSNSTPCSVSSSTITTTIIEGETYSFNGQNLTAAGTYTATLQNAAGCDSVVNLNLTLESIPASCSIETSSQFICSGNNVELSITEVGFSPCSDSNSNTAQWELLIPAENFNGNEINFDPAGFDKTNSKLYSVLKTGGTNRVYCFDLNTNQVINIPSNDGPGELYEAVYDFSNQRLVANRVGRDAVFTLPLSGGSWNQIGNGGFDAESYGANTFWNPITQKFSYFGGYGFFATKNWIWENNGNEWQNTYVNNSNCSPGKRITQVAFNSNNEKVIMFAGYGNCDGNQFASSCALGSPWATDVGVYCWFRDLWELDLNTLQFSNILPVNSQSISREGAFTYDYENDDYYIIGGFIPSGSYSTNVNNYGNTWSNEVLRFKRGEENGFSPISVTGTVPPVSNNSIGNGTAIYDANYNRIILARKDGIWALNLSNCDKSYSWSTGETTSSISVSPTETTTYSVTVTQGNQTCTSEITITVNQPTVGTVNATITEGETYSFNGQNLTTAGTYTATLQNAAGCDSVVTLNLTVEPAVEPLNCEIDAELTNLCVGESSQLTISNSSNVNFTSNQQIQGLTFIGNFENSSYFIDNSNKTWTEANLNAIELGGKLLVINDSLEDAYISALLPAGYFHIGLFQNTSSQNYSEPNGGWEWVDGTPLVYTRWGVLPQEPNNEFGVENYGGIHGSNFPYYRGWNDGQIGFNPSIIELSLISPSSILWSTGETTPSISVSPTETTTYSVTVNQGGQTCTSEITITVNQPTSATVNATITEGETYNFNGQNLTTAGTYTATLQNAAGCDSVVTLNLTVNPAPVAGCYAASVVNFTQGLNAIGNAVSAIRSNEELALGMPEPVVTNVVNFVSLGFGGSITLAFETPIANGAGNDIRIDEATWNNNPCNRYPESADVFASQDGSNFVYLGRVCQDAELDLGQLSWAQYVRLVDVSDLLSFNADADGYDVNGITCLNGAATTLTNDGLVACSLQEIVSYTPGNRKNGTAVTAARSNPANALGTPQNNNTINFTALGFGGTIVAKFDYVVFNQAGNDLRVTETSFGNPSCNNYPEKARVSVSMDNVNWTELGEICQDGEFDLGNVNYAQYIKIQDASPMSSNKFNGAADGYDVDAVMVLNNGCGTSSARLAQMDNTTTPDASMSISAFPNPMEDYTIVNFEGLENDADFNFQIMDAAGRVIRNNNIRVSTANPTYLFDASELARGIYQVVIANENGSYIVRLVK